MREGSCLPKKLRRSAASAGGLSTARSSAATSRPPGFAPGSAFDRTTSTPGSTPRTIGPAEAATVELRRSTFLSVEKEHSKPRGLKQRATERDHREPVEAWAPLLEAAETEFHWPIRYCPECRTILEGDALNPPIDAPLETVIAWDKWRSRWFKKGRPRRAVPPDDVAWPDAA